MVYAARRSIQGHRRRRHEPSAGHRSEWALPTRTEAGFSETIFGAGLVTANEGLEDALSEERRSGVVGRRGRGRPRLGRTDDPLLQPPGNDNLRGGSGLGVRAGSHLVVTRWTPRWRQTTTKEHATPSQSGAGPTDLTVTLGP